MEIKLASFAKLILLISMLFVGASCSNPHEQSTVQIVLPSASELNSKADAGTLSLSLACFSVNVSADDIPSKKSSGCDVPVGAFAGTAQAGETLSLTIKRGMKRKLEIFAYNRASQAESCPKLTEGFGSLNRSKLVRVGQVDSFDALSESIDLKVTISSPPANLNLITQYGLAANCAATAPTGKAPFAGSLGSTSGVTSSGFKVRVQLNTQNTENVKLTPQGYRIIGAKARSL